MPLQALALLRGPVLKSGEYHAARSVRRKQLKDERDEKSRISHIQLQDKVNARGKVRRTPHAGSSGSVPWYVPEGAEWDINTPNSTALIVVSGEQAWRGSDVEIEELEHYHRLADQLYVEECETDWDVAPLRGAARYPTSELDIAYLRPQRRSFREDEICE